MSTFGFSRLFSNNSNRNVHRNRSGSKGKRGRIARIEELEGREMLSVSIGLADFNAISAQYSDLNLKDFAEYNIIEVSGTGDEEDRNHFAFSEAGLRTAITRAGETVENDLIVVRTSATDNFILLTNTLTINTNANIRGEVIIVSYDETYGSQMLTLQGGRLVIGTTGTGNHRTIAKLAGLEITGSPSEGIYVNNNSTQELRQAILTVTQCYIFGNGSSGIYNDTGNVTVTNSIIANNQNRGIYNVNSGSGMSLANSLIIGNSTSGSGAGIYNGNGTLLTVNCTIVGNTSTSTTTFSGGGGLHNFGGSMNLYNTIVVGNASVRNGQDIYIRGGSLTGTNNLVGDVTWSSGGSSLQYIHATSVAGIFASFTPTTSTNWSWKDWDLRLVEGSVAINAGDNRVLQNNPIGLITTDLAGNPRISNGTVDIGAYEYGRDWVESGIIVTHSGDTLTIHGTDGSDWIEIQETTTQIIVHSFSTGRASLLEQWIFTKSEIAMIEFYGNDGDDTFIAAYGGSAISIACRLYGMTGNNRLIGGDGDDYIYGGWWGDSILDGGNGDNVVIGGMGNNTFYNSGIGSSCFIWAGHNNQWADRHFADYNDGFIILRDTDRNGNSFAHDATFRPWKEIGVLKVGDLVREYYSGLGESYAFFRWQGTPMGAIYCTITDTDVWWGALCAWDSSLIFRDDYTVGGFLHEVLHLWHSPPGDFWGNWNPYWNDFRSISWLPNGSLRDDAVPADSYFWWRTIEEIQADGAGHDWTEVGFRTIVGDNPTQNVSEKYYEKVEVFNQFITWLASLPDLEMPANLRSTNVTENSVTLAWNAGAGATGYEVQYRTDGTNWTNVPVTGTSETISGLEPGTEYQFQVRAVNAAGISAWSEEISITTDSIILITLTSISVNTNSPQVGDTITTTLTPNGATATYQWYRGTESAGYGAIAGATSSSYTVTANDAGFILRVVATGTGNYTGTANHTLTNAVQHVEAKLGNPTILSATGTESTLTITWTVDPAAKSYVVEWLNGQDWVTTGVGTTSNGTATITGNFAAGATYFVHVIAKAENEENDSEPEMVTIIIGSAPDPLQPIVTVASVTNNSITLFWPAIAANTDYEIIITSGNEPAGMTIVKSATGAMINGLNPDTNYSFNVIALNTNGIAADAVDVHAKTTNVDDTPIASPTVTIENGVSTSLKVNLPIGTSNENVDVYVIRYWHVDGNNTYHADPIRVNAGTSFVLLTGLKANTQYIITVEAIGKVGFGNATTIVDAPLTSAEVPANVAAVKAAGVKMANAKSATPPTISSITLTWRAQHESITYTIGARDRINSNTSGTIAGTVGTLAVLNQKNFTWLYNERNEIIGVTITGLKAGTRYDFTVTAKDINGNEVLKRNSGVPDSVNVRASTLTPRQAAVKASAVRTSASIDSVSIRWNVPTSGIDGYQIRMLGTNANGVRNQHLATIVINGSGVGNIATITSVVPMPNSGLNEALLMQPSIVFETLRPNTARAVDTMTLKVEGLKAKMSYRFEIQTTGQCAAGDFISTVSRVSASTLNWPAVRSIKLDTRTASSVNLNWTLPRYTTAFPAAADPVTHYQIWLAASAGSPVVLLDTIDARVNNTLITNATITLTEVQRTEIGNRFENSCRLVIRAVVMDGDTILNQSADAMVALRAV